MGKRLAICRLKQSRWGACVRLTSGASRFTVSCDKAVGVGGAGAWGSGSIANFCKPADPLHRLQTVGV